MLLKSVQVCRYVPKISFGKDRISEAVPFLGSRREADSHLIIRRISDSYIIIIPEQLLHHSLTPIGPYITLRALINLVVAILRTPAKKRST